MGAILGTAISGPARSSAADRYDDQIRSLQAQRAALATRLSTLRQEQTGAAQAAVSAQAQLAATESSLADGQARLDRDNTELATTAQRIQAVDAQLTRDRAALTRIVVRLYTMDDATTLNALVDSPNMYRLIDTALDARNVSAKLEQLVAQVGSERRSLSDLQQREAVEELAATAVVAQLRGLQAQQQAQEQRFRQQAASLTGEAAQVAGQSQEIVAGIAAIRALQEAAARAAAALAAQGAAAAQHADGVLPPFAFGPRADDFPWGQCTWYVASLRDVSWGGDAWEWLAGARAAGMATGITPRVGSIVVWGPGGGYSRYGHVAYVVAVQGPSRFAVDESNYYEIPGRLDRRQIDTLSGVEGFIY